MLIPLRLMYYNLIKFRNPFKLQPGNFGSLLRLSVLRLLSHCILMNSPNEVSTIVISKLVVLIPQIIVTGIAVSLSMS